MSLRDRLRPAQVEPPVSPEDREAAAAALLSVQRGRASYSPPPAAGKAAAQIMRPLWRQTSVGLSEMKRRWADIVGEPFGSKTQPEKLAGGTLTLRAPGALAPFLQQQIPLLIERLRLAGAEVKAVRLEQRALARPASNVHPARRLLSPEEDAALAQELDRIADPSLKSALLRLGRAVKQG
jgi:hypothetical protein